MLNISNILIYSPLEQFDVASWSLYNKVIEVSSEVSLQNNLCSVVGLVYDNIPMFYSVYDFSIALEIQHQNMVSIYVAVIFLSAVFYYSDVKEVKTVTLFMIMLFHFFSMGFLVIWFSDNLFAIEDLEFESDNSKILKALILPQIEFSLVIDENMISFLAAFLLLGGSEEQEDQDFLIDNEGSDYIEDIVASLFISNLGKDVEDNGALFLKVCAIFSFVLTNNIMGMLPYSDTGTSSLVLTFWVALSVFVSLLILMIRRNGVHHFFGLFMPSGCPLPLIFILIPIEFISYTFRLVSLSVRLFANMMAGHTLLKVIVSFSWTMILMGDIFLIVNLFPILILFVLIFLELAVALIQSYIFTILTCIYLKDIFESH